MNDRFQLVRPSSNDRQVFEDAAGNLFLALTDSTTNALLKVMPPADRFLGDSNLRFCIPVMVQQTQQLTQVKCGLGVANYLAGRYGVSLIIEADGATYELVRRPDSP